MNDFLIKNDEILVVLDDTAEKNDIIADVIGNKGFSDVVVKKKTLAEHFGEAISAIFGVKPFILRNHFEIAELKESLEDKKDSHVLHFFAHFVISECEKAALTLKKLVFVDSTYLVLSEGKIAAVMFLNTGDYKRFLKDAANATTLSAAKQLFENDEEKRSMPIESLVDISLVENFIQVIAGGFDARYFNSLEGSLYTITKRSADKAKIKAEYTFYHLLPDDMKMWFVAPFDYREDQNGASYTMERLYMTDLAIKWVHGSIDAAEFSALMDKYFFFFSSRHKKTVSFEKYGEIAENLYTDKVKKRIAQLKTLPQYKKIADLLFSATPFKTIDSLLEQYFLLKSKIESRFSSQKKQEPCLVIGHGDPCFANAMYNKAVRTLKFIDPKGAMSEEELFTNEYYDVAKLSHSVCGLYDFFNNALFEIGISEDFLLTLSIDFDNTVQKNIFRAKCEASGFDFALVRLYEASLFLSMLPLHIDYPHKVLGFILNAHNILKEIQNEEHI